MRNVYISKIDSICFPFVFVFHIYFIHVLSIGKSVNIQDMSWNGSEAHVNIMRNRKNEYSLTNLYPLLKSKWLQNIEDRFIGDVVSLQRRFYCSWYSLQKRQTTARTLRNNNKVSIMASWAPLVPSSNAHNCSIVWPTKNAQVERYSFYKIY